MTLSPLVPQLWPLEPVREQRYHMETGWYPASVNPVWPGTYEVEVYMGGVESPDIHRWTFGVDGYWYDTFNVKCVLHSNDKWRGVQL